MAIMGDFNSSPSIFFFFFSIQIIIAYFKKAVLSVVDCFEITKIIDNNIKEFNK